jgi:hypothetical protein
VDEAYVQQIDRAVHAVLDAVDCGVRIGHAEVLCQRVPASSRDERNRLSRSIACLEHFEERPVAACDENAGGGGTRSDE